jgi:hypothetical protein
MGARRHTKGFRATAAAVLTAALAALPAIALGTAAAPAATNHKAFAAPKSGYIVYWDQNEEQDYYASANHSQGQLETPWDPNGQMCIVPHTNGKWVIGYDPTNPSQHNPGGPPHHPFKQPPDGVELNNPNGTSTHHNLFVPGRFHDGKGTPGGDTPPDSKGVYNGQSTYTGCATDSKGNVFGADIATAQGDFPVPTSGRLVEWFAPKYTTYCILYGPTTGGVGPHHVDGTGGLAQPGMMTTMANNNLLLPVAGGSDGQLIGGQVWELDHSSFPTSAAQCPGGMYPRSKFKYTVWLQGHPDYMPFPMAVAHDPTCDCYAVDTAFGSPAIEWYTDKGTPVAGHATIAGETVQQLGQLPNGFNPFGMAFAPDGTLYFVDIHLACTGVLQNCGAGNQVGRVLRVTFTNGQPSAPAVINSGFNFPTSVTICVIGHGACPWPSHKTPPPNRAASAPTGG